jgi:superfamily I DNA/RNA helicase
MILSTIHSAKGRQANTVVLLTDLPVPSKQALLRMAERDAEIRTWYVGVTRARESLLIANRRGNPVIERALRV